MEENEYVVLPESDMYYSVVRKYTGSIPQEGYRQASQQAREAFRDLKFGVRVHWGLYSQWRLQGESWPFLRMPYKKRQEYQQLYQQFNPDGFDAGQWMRLFRRGGAKCFAITTKHHEGFSLFDTKTTVRQRVNWLSPGGPAIEDCEVAYSVMDTPFRRDIIAELCDAARENGIKIDLYFSNPDWYDADFRPYGYHPLTVPDVEALITQKEIDDIPAFFGEMRPVEMPALTPIQKQRAIARHRQQLLELLRNYGPIDMLCLDNWLGEEVWTDLLETIKQMRSIQPDCMLRCRGIGNYGDYYTPEGYLPGSKANTDMPWMVIYPLGKTFSYDPDAGSYKGGEWIIRSLIDIVAKGGNFMVGIGPDAHGCFHPKAVQDLQEAGDWLAVNGEAIYGTRPRPEARYREEDVFFTQTKDGSHIFAISTGWPGAHLRLHTVCPSDGMTVRMLGWTRILPWQRDGQGVRIDLPEVLQNPAARPCKTAYAFCLDV